MNKISYIPPYTYFYNNGRNPYTEGKVLPLAASRPGNPLWRNYGIGGIVFGVGLFILGITVIPLEVSRIMAGSLNRLTTGSYLLYPNYNFDINGALQQIRNFIPDVVSGNNPSLGDAGIVPQPAVGLIAPGNFPVQDKYVWPWSHAALLFSLVTIAAGILGILSGCRRTYTTIYAFFILSLLSGFLSIFLIAYFATQINWHLVGNANRRFGFYYYTVDFALGATLLGISSVTLIFSFLAAVFAGLSAGVCLGPKSPLMRISDFEKQNKKAANKPNNQNPSRYTQPQQI